MYLGIDPGASGGLASIGGSGSADAIKMPKTLEETWSWFDSHAEVARYAEYHAVLEKVGGFIRSYSSHGKYEKGQGVGAGPAMFNFGASYGRLQAFLTASSISYMEVRPRAWQGGLGIEPRKKSENSQAFKNRLKCTAQSTFPDIADKITLATCDALLLAHYCRLLNS